MAKGESPTQYHDRGFREIIDETTDWYRQLLADDNLDDTLLVGLLETCVERANHLLAHYELIGRTALVSDVLHLDEDGDLCLNSAVLEARYMGLYLANRTLQVDGEDEVSATVPQIWHRVLLASSSVQREPFYTSSTASFGLLPVQSDSIDLIDGVITTVENERWLTKLTQKITTGNYEFGDLAILYDVIRDKKHLRTSVDKRIDWYIELLNDRVFIEGKPITLTTTFFMGTDPERQLIHFNEPITVTASFCSFISMPQFEIVDGKDAYFVSMQAEPKQLGVAVRRLDEETGEEMVIHIPVKDCMGETAFSE